MANLSRLTTIIFYQSIYFLVASYSTSHLAIFFQSFPTFFASPHYSNISSYVFFLISSYHYFSFNPSHHFLTFFFSLLFHILPLQFLQPFLSLFYSSFSHLIFQAKIHFQSLYFGGIFILIHTFYNVSIQYFIFWTYDIFDEKIKKKEKKKENKKGIRTQINLYPKIKYRNETL